MSLFETMKHTAVNLRNTENEPVVGALIVPGNARTSFVGSVTTLLGFSPNERPAEKNKGLAI